MLCACSGERFQFEDAPQSPESLATRDFSASGISSKTAEWDSNFDDTQVDDVECALKETESLNYEEARALLGRLEYQRGNFDAALQVFQGIDIRGLKPKMIKAIVERTKPRKNRYRGEISQPNVMSLHSASLLLEAILLKSKSLEELGREKEAAIECTTILDIVEAAWPRGIPETVGNDFKLIEMFHKALELLPKLWKRAGHIEEAITTCRRALMKPWKLDPQRLAELQKDLAVVLLYGGCDSVIPSQMQQTWGSATPKNCLEEAILLLFVLMRKAVFREILWDSEILDHLAFALSTSGQFEILARHVEAILPGLYSRGERWYLLALCYSASDQHDVALNLLRKALGRSEKKRKHYLHALLLSLKLCAQNKSNATEGIKIAQRASLHTNRRDKHFFSVVDKWLGVCYGNSWRTSMSDSKRHCLQKESLCSLGCAAEAKRDDPETMFRLAVENALQRNLKLSLECAVKCSDLVAGSSVKCWKLLALILSAEQNFKEAEAIVDLALGETGVSDQVELLRLKAVLQNFQEQPTNTLQTYKKILTIVEAQKDLHVQNFNSGFKESDKIEMDAWLDLTEVYIKLGLLSDSETCLSKARLAGNFYSRSWYIAGKLLEAKLLYNDALVAFSVSLSIEPDYVPSMVSTASMLMKIWKTALPIARSFLMNALQLDPMNHEAWFNLGLVSKAEGLPVQAADCFQAACDLSQSAPVLDIT